MWKTYRMINKLKSWFLIGVNVDTRLDLLQVSKSVRWVNPIVYSSSVNLFVQRFNALFSMRTNLTNNQFIDVRTECSTNDVVVSKNSNIKLQNTKNVTTSFFSIVLQYRLVGEWDGDTTVTIIWYKNSVEIARSVNDFDIGYIPSYRERINCATSFSYSQPYIENMNIGYRIIVNGGATCSSNSEIITYQSRANIKNGLVDLNVIAIERKEG